MHGTKGVLKGQLLELVFLLLFVLLSLLVLVLLLQWFRLLPWWFLLQQLQVDLLSLVDSPAASPCSFILCFVC